MQAPPPDFNPSPGCGCPPSCLTTGLWVLDTKLVTSDRDQLLGPEHPLLGITCKGWAHLGWVGALCLWMAGKEPCSIIFPSLWILEGH